MGAPDEGRRERASSPKPWRCFCRPPVVNDESARSFERFEAVFFLSLSLSRHRGVWARDMPGEKEEPKKSSSVCF